MEQNQDFAPTLGITISRGRSSGWVIWKAGDAVPEAYCSTLPETWAVASRLMGELGRDFGEVPFLPQQPQLAYQPQRPMPQAQSQPHHYNMPPTQPAPETFPNVVERERVNSLADSIAAVKANGRGAANSIAAACLALIALSQVWPFGA